MIIDAIGVEVGNMEELLREESSGYVVPNQFSTSPMIKTRGEIMQCHLDGCTIYNPTYLQYVL